MLCSCKKKIGKKRAALTWGSLREPAARGDRGDNRIATRPTGQPDGLPGGVAAAATRDTTLRVATHRRRRRRSASRAVYPHVERCAGFVGGRAAADRGPSLLPSRLSCSQESQTSRLQLPLLPSLFESYPLYCVIFSQNFSCNLEFFVFSSAKVTYLLWNSFCTFKKFKKKKPSNLVEIPLNCTLNNTLLLIFLDRVLANRNECHS